jgi:hypothetical protein
MENKFTLEEEAIITFFAWSSGHDIEDISQEIREAIYPAINQLPETSKKMMYRMGGLMQLVFSGSNLSNNILLEEATQNAYFLSLVAPFIQKLDLNEELKNLYLDFANILIDMRINNKPSDLLQGQMELIVAKETTQS